MSLVKQVKQGCCVQAEQTRAAKGEGREEKANGEGPAGREFINREEHSILEEMSCGGAWRRGRGGKGVMAEGVLPCLSAICRSLSATDASQ